MMIFQEFGGAYKTRFRNGSEPFQQTIADFDRKKNTVRLKVPNEEVKRGLFNDLLPLYVKPKGSTVKTILDGIVDGFLDGKPEEMLKYVYVIELKYDGTAEEALRQIEEKEYALQFDADGRKAFRIGISFSSELRRIDAWKILFGEGRGVDLD